VMHCHNNLHEDHAMMLRFDIGNPNPISDDRTGGQSIKLDDYKKIVKGTLS
jgi:hypothetical protein